MRLMVPVVTQIAVNPPEDSLFSALNGTLTIEMVAKLMR